MRRSIYTERIIFEVDPDLKKGLDQYAEEEKTTRAELIRRLLRKGLQEK